MLFQDFTGSYYKPASFCPANQTCFTHTRWRTWGTTAVGYGTAHFTNPTGGGRTYRTTIRLSRIRHICGGRRYTLAAWSGGQTFFIACAVWSGG